jgi:hypothetical protein
MRDVAEVPSVPESNLLIFDTWRLVNDLMRSGLVNEYPLLVYPLRARSRQTLFHEGVEGRLRLTEGEPYRAGVLLLRYEGS